MSYDRQFPSFSYSNFSGKKKWFLKKKKISRKFQLMTVILSMSGPQRERNIFPGRNKKSVAINPRLGATTFVIILDVFVASTFESVSDFHRRKFHSKSFNFDSIVATRSIYPQNLFEWKTFLKYFGEHCAKLRQKCEQCGPMETSTGALKSGPLQVH